MTSSGLDFAYVREADSDFLALFPHRFDYIYAPHPEPNHAPAWQTESRHPLTDRLIDQGRFLYGVRFGKTSRYCLLDIDAGSPYHPQQDPLAIARITAAVEAIGLVRHLAITSSYSGGIHLYFPLAISHSSWELGSAVTLILENAGFTVKPGLLEVFPNRKTYRVQGQPGLFNAHRLPLQNGSYLLNSDFEPVWSDRSKFVQQWQSCQSRNTVHPSALRRVLRQHSQTHHRVSGKAAKFLNDLNSEIETGWTGPGQTNYLLGRIALRCYIFHHLLEGGSPLTGQALIDQITQVARSLPGYREWCGHQHEIEHRSAEWARCVENSRYFHYGIGKPDQTLAHTDLFLSTRSTQSKNWNQEQSQNTRDRIFQAIADLLEQNALPIQTTARFKALLNYGIGGGSLYRHKDLWHPGFLNLPDQELKELDLSDHQKNSSSSEIAPDSAPNSTSLLLPAGGNALTDVVSEPLDRSSFELTGGNALQQAALTDRGLEWQIDRQFDQLDRQFDGQFDRSNSGQSGCDPLSVVTSRVNDQNEQTDDLLNERSPGFAVLRTCWMDGLIEGWSGGLIGSIDADPGFKPP